MIRVVRKIPRSGKVLALTDRGEKVLWDEEGDYYSRTTSSSDDSDWWPAEIYNDLLPGTERLTLFIPGNPGAGKSYYASQIIQRMREDMPILLFTSLDEDDDNFRAFSDRIMRVRMEPDTLRAINCASIRARLGYGQDVLALFDDVDKIADRELNKATFNVIQDLLANGRVHDKSQKGGNIHVIATTHSLNDGMKTKYLTENSDYVALFPKSTTHMQLERLLSKIGLRRDIIPLLKSIRGRVCLIRKTAPMFFCLDSNFSLI